MKLLSDYKSINNSEETKIYEDNVDILKAVKLNENKVFVAFSYITKVSPTQARVHGVVIEIKGNQISIGPKTYIGGNTYNKDEIAQFTIDALNANKVLVTFSNMQYSSNDLYARICTINGLTITAGDVKGTSYSINRGCYLTSTTLSESTGVLASAFNGEYAYGYIYILEVERNYIKTKNKNYFIFRKIFRKFHIKSFKYKHY